MYGERVISPKYVFLIYIDSLRGAVTIFRVRKLMDLIPRGLEAKI